MRLKYAAKNKAILPTAEGFVLRPQVALPGNVQYDRSLIWVKLQGSGLA